eukprot:g20224.t1
MMINAPQVAWWRQFGQAELSWFSLHPKTRTRIAISKDTEMVPDKQNFCRIDNIKKAPKTKNNDCPALQATSSSGVDRTSIPYRQNCEKRASMRITEGEQIIDFNLFESLQSTGVNPVGVEDARLGTVTTPSKWGGRGSEPGFTPEQECAAVCAAFPATWTKNNPKAQNSKKEKPCVGWMMYRHRDALAAADPAQYLADYRLTPDEGTFPFPSKMSKRRCYNKETTGGAAALPPYSLACRLFSEVRKIAVNSEGMKKMSEEDTSGPMVEEVHAVGTPCNVNLKGEEIDYAGKCKSNHFGTFLDWPT